MQISKITGFISIRNKPDSQACAAAEQLYKEIKEGSCKYNLKGGKLVSKNAFIRMLSMITNPSIKLLLVTAMAAIFSMVFGVYAIRSVTKPLDKLSLEIACAVSGDFNRNIDVMSYDETGKLLSMVATMNKNMKRVL